MRLSAHKLKSNMLELTRLFGVERSPFQKFVIVYKYIRLLTKDPITKSILQKIFDDTSSAMAELNPEGLNEGEFLDVKAEAIYTDEFWTYYRNLEVIHGKMKKMKHCEIRNQGEYDNLRRLYSRPYSEEMLALSFKVVNSNIFEQLDQEVFFNPPEKEVKTWLDDENSIFYLRGEKIKIDKQNKITNAHKILRHIFINNSTNIKDDFYYSEIAEDEFGDSEYKQDPRAWRKYNTACNEVNRKIMEQTKDRVDNFLIFNSGKLGKVSVNRQYL